MSSLEQDVRTILLRIDMCSFGKDTHVHKTDGERGPVLKPTGFLTSSWCIAKELNMRCGGDHKHVPLVGGRAAGAAIYPPELCRAICQRLVRQKEY